MAGFIRKVRTYEIEEYIKLTGVELTDGQIFESKVKVTIANKRTDMRAIYQYRKKRAKIDLLNIDKLLYKAQRMVEGKLSIKRNRFLKIIGEHKEINTALLDSARMRAGIKGYVTNLDIPANLVVATVQTPIGTLPRASILGINPPSGTLSAEYK